MSRPPRGTRPEPRLRALGRYLLDGFVRMGQAMEGLVTFWVPYQPPPRRPEPPGDRRPGSATTERRP
jgi:hypothetical protein